MEVYYKLTIGVIVLSPTRLAVISCRSLYLDQVLVSKRARLDELVSRLVRVIPSSVQTKEKFNKASPTLS